MESGCYRCGYIVCSCPCAYYRSGLLCGATTNTPALGAATQALEHVGVSRGSVALATAVTYPLGVLGVILAMVFIRKLFVRPRDLEVRPLTEDDHTCIAQFVIVNPAVAGKSIAELGRMTHVKFIISRLWRADQVIVPMASTQLQQGDNVLIITNKDDEAAMEILFGRRVQKDYSHDIDWNAIDANVESRILVVTRTRLNGQRLGQLHLRQSYGVNVSRVIRGDIKLLATDDLRLQYGDRVTVVGSHDAVNNVEEFFGNSVKTLNEPNIGAIFTGIILGLMAQYLFICLVWTVLFAWVLLVDQSSWESSLVLLDPRCTSSLIPPVQLR